MSQEKLEKHDQYINDDRYATQKDLKILSLELEQKISKAEQNLERMINSITLKLGSLMIACSGILFGLLQYFHK